MPCGLRDEALAAALVGRWRLVYSSTFAGEPVAAAAGGRRSQGLAGSPPGVGAVFQEVRPRTGGGGGGGWALDNQVELVVSPSTLGLPRLLPLPPLRLRASLRHAMRADGAAVRVDLEGTTVRVAGRPGQASLPAPRVALGLLRAEAGKLLPGGRLLSGVERALDAVLGTASQGGGVGGPLAAPLKAARDFETRASTFAVTALAEADTGKGEALVVRVSRSALGEMRVFVKGW